MEGSVDPRHRRRGSRQPSTDRSSQALFANAEVSSRRQEALIQAGLVLASELSLPAVLQKIVELACVVADARYGALGVLGQDGRLSDFITYGVTDKQRRAIGNLPVGEGILGVLITAAYPLRLQRIQDDQRSVGFPANHPPMTSFLGVPVSVRGRVYGNLYLTEKRDAPEFTLEDERAVVTLAALAGVAFENPRLFAEAQERLAMEARHRLARELHDSVSQALFSMTLETGAAQLALREGRDRSGRSGKRLGPPPGQAAGADRKRLGGDARADLRAAAGGAPRGRARRRPSASTPRPSAARADLVIDVETPEHWLSLAPDLEEQLYRTAQEALTNVVKHADARHAWVKLLRHSRNATLGAAGSLRRRDRLRPRALTAGPSWADDHATTGRAAGWQLGGAQYTGQRDQHSGAGAAARCRAAGLDPVEGSHMKPARCRRAGSAAGSGVHRRRPRRRPPRAACPTWRWWTTWR